MHTSEYPPGVGELVAAEAVQPEASRAPSFGAKRALWILLSYFLVQIGVGIVFGMAFALAHIKLSGGPLMLMAIVGGVAGSGLAWRMARNSFASQSALDFRDAIGVRSAPTQQVAIAAAVGLLLSALFGLVLMPMFPPSSPQQLGPLVAAVSEGGWVLYVCTFFAVCIAPPSEELIFRGVFFAGLARRMSGILAALISSVAFVLIHVSSTSPYWPALVAVALLALAAQLARVRTGSLVPGIAMHAVYNAALFAAAYQH